MTRADYLAEQGASLRRQRSELGLTRAAVADGIGASETAPQIVHKALQIIGILAFKNDSPFSLGRHYRDVLSASLMISNDRIAGKSAAMLMVFKDD